MMPTIEETATAADLAQIEHEEWLRVLNTWAERERWEALEVIEGPLLTKTELDDFRADQAQFEAEERASFKA